MLSVCAHAASPTENEPIDISILEHSNELMPFLTAAQKVQYLRLESTINQAQSDMKSGHYLANSKPSSLNPNRDLKPQIERGKQIIARAQLELDSAQSEMVALFMAAKDQQAQQVAIDLTRFDYDLESAKYDDAITVICKRLLNACWELGYETLLFDGIFIQDSEVTQRASAELRNSTYDQLIKVDGTTFSVTIPINLQLEPDSEGTGSEIFSYENASIFKDDKKALLAIEMIQPEGSSTGLLSLRAIDLKTQHIVAHQLIKIKNLAEKLELEAEGLMDKIPDRLKLRDTKNTLQKLSNLGSLYTFQVTDDFDTSEVHELLTHTLLQNSTLQITDSDFILRAYGASLAMPDAWRGQGNANLKISEDEQTGTYQLSAIADSSELVLPSGILQLSHSTPVISNDGAEAEVTEPK